MVAHNTPTLSVEELMRRAAEAKVLLHCACGICGYRLKEEKHFLCEHSAGA